MTNNMESLQEIKSNSKPCPFCGSKNLSFKFNINQGHGHCVFSNARIMCNDCTGSKGNGSGYSEPDESEEMIIWKQWNQRK